MILVIITAIIITRLPVAVIVCVVDVVDGAHDFPGIPGCTIILSHGNPWLEIIILLLQNLLTNTLLIPLVRVVVVVRATRIFDDPSV